MSIWSVPFEVCRLWVWIQYNSVSSLVYLPRYIYVLNHVFRNTFDVALNFEVTWKALTMIHHKSVQTVYMTTDYQQSRC
jgi:hypothetical protein